MLVISVICFNRANIKNHQQEVDGFFFVQMSTQSLRIQICPKKGISPIILFWGCYVSTINPTLGRVLDFRDAAPQAMKHMKHGHSLNKNPGCLADSCRDTLMRLDGPLPSCCFKMGPGKPVTSRTPVIRVK